jgi:ABC-type arginine transport system ATPase subunit
MKNISSKELNYLKDLMSWELLACKKSFDYSQKETNPARQDLFTNAAMTHQQNYLDLVNYLNSLKQASGGMS